MIIYFLNLGTSLEDYNYENQAIADIIKNEIGDVQFMGMSVRRKKNNKCPRQLIDLDLSNFEYQIFVLVFYRQARNLSKQTFKIRHV